MAGERSLTVELDDGSTLVVVAELLAQAPDEAAELLRQEAGEQLPAQLVDRLRALVGDPVLATAAGGVLAGLEDPTPPDEPGPTQPQLRMDLPRSWFTGSTDPVNEHPLFLRYLPELRSRADWPVPPVNVTADEDLEPGGFRILVDGELAAIGRLDPAARYCSAEAVSLLPGAASGVPAPAPTEYGWTVPAALPADPGLVDLLSMPAVEVATRVYGDATARFVQATEVPTEPTDAKAAPAV